MSLRTAVEQSRWLTLAVFAVGAWVLFTLVRVVDTMGTPWADQTVGQTFASGFVGAVVLAALLAMAVVVVGELGSTEPAPEAWPPEE